MSHSTKVKLVLLDRDGVINVDHQKSLLSLAGFEFIPGSVSALKKLQEAGFKMAVVTNQRCVGRGDLSPEGLDEIHAHMKQELKKEGILLEVIFACTDHPDRPTHRMKPNPGMLEEAMAHFGADPKDTYMIGDQITDMKAAYVAGCARHLVLTGHGEKTLQNPELKTFEPFVVHTDLKEAVNYILRNPCVMAPTGKQATERGRSIFLEKVK
jgi:D-glycero-D-manno-heptose 1,7-bisphosphate phosphatase